MRKLLTLIFVLFLMLIGAGATAESKPTVSFPERSGSINGGFDYTMVVNINRVQANDLPIIINNTDTGETLTLVIPAGKTSASLVIPTAPVSATVKTTYKITNTDAYYASATHVLSVTPLPNVRFYNKMVSTTAGHKLNVTVYCLNPEAISKQNNVFTLRDQYGRELARTAWTHASGQLQISFLTSSDMFGHNELTLWLDEYCVTAQSLYALVTGDRYYGQALWSVEIDQPLIAIGIDCGDKDDNTDKILEVLEKHNVKATFFMTGRFLKTYPDSVKKIYAAGHEIANHSESHKHMNELTIYEVYNQLMTPVSTAEELLGVTPRLFRPPYGEYNANVVSVCRSEGMEVIRWDPNYHDSVGYYPIEKIYAFATTDQDYQPGAIVLCHLEGYGQPISLEKGLTYYESLGLNAIPISALLCASGRKLPDLPFNREPLVYTNEYWETWIEREMPELLAN